MKAPRRVLTASLSALTVGGAMLAALSAAPAANATVNSATAQARAPFSTKLQVNHSLKCLDVANASTADAAFVQQWDCYNAPGNQTWHFVIASDGYYTVRASHSGKCLDVGAWSQAEGAEVYQWTCHGGTNQQWKLVQRPNGFFSLVARLSGKCLSVTAGSMSNGAGVVQQSCDSALPYQEWRLL